MNSNFECKIVSSLEKVFPDEGARDMDSVNSISGLKGECVSFQIAYKWNGKTKGFAFIDFESSIKESISVKTVDLVPCAYPCKKETDESYLRTSPGLYPDCLSEIFEFGFVLVPNQWRSLWVDIYIDESIKSLEQIIKFKIFANENLMKDLESPELASFDFKINIINEVLPKLPIKHTEWFHADCLANYYKVEVFSEKHWEIIENFISIASKNKCNMILTPVFTPPLDTMVGGERKTVQLVNIDVIGENKYKFDFSKLERWIAICIKHKIEYFEISHLFTQWGAEFCPKIMAKKDGKLVKIFSWDTKATSEEYSFFLKQFLKELKAFLRKRNLLEKTYFHISDEPKLEQLEAYRLAKNIVSEEIKDCNVFDALSNYDFYKEGLVDIPVCATDHIENFLKQRPKELWAYYCTGQSLGVSNRFIAQSGWHTRILGTQLYKEKIAGFLHWGFNFYNSQYSLYPIDPYRCTDADCAFPSGDPFLVYPDDNGKPKESLRLKYINQAMSDLSAMYLLEKKIGREAVIALIDKETMISFSNCPKNIGQMQRIRERINKALTETKHCISCCLFI